MKKFIIISAIACLFTGCSSPFPEKEIIDNRLYFIATDERFSYVRTQFENRFDKALNYSELSLLEITSDTGIKASTYGGFEELEKRLDPRLAAMNKCFADGNLKIESVTIANSKSFQIASSDEEINKCIIAKSNEPMKDIAILLLDQTNIFNELKNTPPLREKINKAKADEVITIKEYIDIVQTIDSIKKSNQDQKMKNVIKNL
ncbi:hypothetical protein ACQWTT_001132 [Acinetobacter baumannii]